MKTYPQNILNQIKENYILGVLADENESFPNLGDDNSPITYASQMNDIIFYIKPLSQEPKEIREVEQNSFNMAPYYIGFANRFFNNSFNNYNYSINERIDSLRTKLKNKLILFKPVLKVDERRERYHKNIDEIVIEEDDWIYDMEYHAVPNIQMTRQEFEKALINQEAIDLKQYNHAMPAPLFLMCENHIYGNIKENQWRIDSSKSNSARILISPKTIKRIELTDTEYIEKIVSEREAIVFVEEPFLMETISERIEKEGVSGDEWENEWMDTPSSETTFTDEVVHGYTKVREVSSNELREIDFIKELDLRAKERKLVYAKTDLINFHASVKSSALTILTGQSGIGKTQLATLYGETLGLSQDNDTMLILPVSPAYTEPGDILGYLNPTTGLYMPAETGLVDFLRSADENENQVHMLIMEEMNLSQIEHYFSPFISLLELEEKNRLLKLYSEGAVCHNNQTYKPSIRLRDNLIIVGTMNMDETTKDLSDRLLDRANVVVLEKRSFKEIKDELSMTKDNPTINKNIGAEDAYGQLYMSWRSKKDSWEAFSDKELEFFDELDKSISKVDPLKGFSIRNIMRMGTYLNSIPVDIEDSYQIESREAVDLFIKQRVITKIRGPVETYESLIGTLRTSEETPDGQLYKLFDSDEAKEISDFTKTKIDLIRKARELFANGYAT
ncbi:hypothetical protein DZB87_26510 [Bacillus sp. ALD]|nr:hypothetical protein DZB87_26510 [Bacillus sp. ALD]